MTANRQTDELRRRVKKDLRDQFRIESVLACGVSSLVFLATDVAHGRPVALKVVAMPTLPPELAPSDLVMRFEAMAGGISSLKHSHLVPIFDFGSSDLYLWYSMQREKGPSLEEVLTASGPLDLRRTLGIIEQAASALDFLHRRGFAHGALKPSQIFLVDGKWARVADQSLSRILRPVKPEDDEGWSEYVAPEDKRTLAGSAAADQFALAMTAHRCLFGPAASAGSTSSVETREDAAGNPDQPRASFVNTRGGDIPDHIVDALERARSASPQQRFASVLDFATLLRGGSWVLSNPRERRTRTGRKETPRAFVPGESSRPAEVVKRALDSAKANNSARSILPSVREGGVLARIIHAGPMTQKISVGGAALILVLAGAAFLSRGSGASPEQMPLLERATPPASTEGTESAAPQQEVESNPTPEAAANSAGSPSTEQSPVGQPGTNETVPPNQESSADPTRDAAPVEAPVPAEPGQLFVNSRPWGRLYVDGMLIGNTPQTGLPISPGQHVIQILRDGYEPYEVEIEVQAGDTIRLTEIELTRGQL